MDWKEKLSEMKTRLERERDELRLKAHLAKMDARDELDGLEGKWAAFKSKVSEIELSEVGEDVREAADKLGEELREGYARVRSKILKDD